MTIPLSERPCDMCGKAPGEFTPGQVLEPEGDIDVVVCSAECMTAWFVKDTERMRQEATSD